jgi:hypothetical protein
MSFLKTLACARPVAGSTVFADVVFATSVASSGDTHAFATQSAAAVWGTVSRTGIGDETYEPATWPWT